MFRIIFSIAFTIPCIQPTHHHRVSGSFPFYRTKRTQTHAASRFAAIGLCVHSKRRICSTLFDATPTKCIVIAFITSITKGSSRRQRPFGSKYTHCFTSCDHFACLWMRTYACDVFAIIFSMPSLLRLVGLYRVAYISNSTICMTTAHLSHVCVFFSSWQGNFGSLIWY